VGDLAFVRGTIGLRQRVGGGVMKVAGVGTKKIQKTRKSEGGSKIQKGRYYGKPNRTEGNGEPSTI